MHIRVQSHTALPEIVMRLTGDPPLLTIPRLPHVSSGQSHFACFELPKAMDVSDELLEDLASSRDHRGCLVRLFESQA